MSRGSMGVFAATFAVFVGSPAIAGTLTVIVLDENAAVSGAQVCLGSGSSRTSLGTALTNASGVAAFPQAPAGAYRVTASVAHRGAEATVTPPDPTSLSLTLRLAPGGPTCSSLVVQPLPTGAAVPGGGGSVVVPSPFVLKNTPVPVTLTTPVSGRRTEFCFGALGAGCGQPQTGIPFTALCGFGSCSINSGSWRHDECCSSHPQGMACRHGPLDDITGHDGNCVAEWNRALSRLADYTWRRDVDFNKPNATGIVVFADYCARKDSRLHEDDVQFCCSGRAHQQQVASKFADTNLRICD